MSATIIPFPGRARAPAAADAAVDRLPARAPTEQDQALVALLSSARRPRRRPAAETLGFFDNPALEPLRAARFRGAAPGLTLADYLREFLADPQARPWPAVLARGGVTVQLRAGGGEAALLVNLRQGTVAQRAFGRAGVSAWRELLVAQADEVRQREEPGQWHVWAAFALPTAGARADEDSAAAG